MIRVAVVDDHHAVRIGLHAALSAEPDLEPVGEATCAAEVPSLVYRTDPDVLIVDYRLPDADGLSVCRRTKQGVPVPAVVLHSAFADDWLTLPAVLAGVDGIVHKGAPARELVRAIRAVAEGRSALPRVLPEYLAAACEPLDHDDCAILGMLVHGTTHADAASVLRIDMRELNRRLDRILGRLRVGIPSA